jgi:uncharacterized protein YbjT (DUF2867 family)
VDATGTYLVIGATGQSGRAAVEALRARGAAVRALVREGSDASALREAGCEVVPGDVTRPETLPPALLGVGGIVDFIGIGHDLRTRPATVAAVEIAGNRNLIEAAVATGADPHVVYLSALMAERAPHVRPFAAKLATEQRLRESGLPFTILRPSNLTESIWGDFVSNGVANLAGRFPHPTSPISVHDLGEIAARCLTEGAPSNALHELFGRETASFPNVIERWADAIGVRVKYRSMPLPAFRVVTTVAAPIRPLFPVIYTLIRSFNELDWSGDAGESRRLAGRELLTVAEAATRRAVRSNDGRSASGARRP